MRRVLFATILALSQFGCTPPPPPAPDPATKTELNQGSVWTRQTRAQFYKQDQGSRIMPLSWIEALKQPDGTPFMADNLNRYGYLKNNEDPSTTLPVGFTTNTDKNGIVAIGMNCAACHTRQIEVDGKPLRVDGGPAIADFQSFLADVDKATGKVLTNGAAFKDFAATVLGAGATKAQITQLHTDVNDWYRPYHAIIAGSLPKPAWGPSRLDAVGMIFNRLTGLDIGSPKQGYIIPANIRKADSPARYPFIWNASIQDKTQWPGFAGNGNDLLAMARNTGEVFGVFAHFHPKKVLGITDFVADNSANIKGLLELETLIKKIGWPRFPWNVDQALAKQGEEIFNSPLSSGTGCAACHGIKVQPQALGAPTWCTPVQDVGTDTREYNVIGRTGIDTGMLNGVGIPGLVPALKPKDDAINVLKVAVIGTIIPHIGEIAWYEIEQDLAKDPIGLIKERRDRSMLKLAEAYAPKHDPMCHPDPSGKGPFDGPHKYESRVLQGIWAAAPYLHNGAVPTLDDLLKPVSERPKAFKIGPAYDPNGKVGLAAEQTKFDYIHKTTADCRKHNDSGTSVCGHEFGTNLSADQKKALLEYLKTL